MNALQSFLSLATIQSLIRAALKVGGGYLLARGIADENTMEALTAGAMALAAVLWGVWHRGKEDGKKMSTTGALTIFAILALAASALGCASANARAFRVEKLTADTGVATLSAWKAYYNVAVAEADVEQRNSLSNQNERVYAASRTLAAALYAVDEVRERCVTNNAASNRFALQITLDVAESRASNLVWLVKTFPR